MHPLLYLLFHLSRVNRRSFCSHAAAAAAVSGISPPVQKAIAASAPSSAYTFEMVPGIGTPRRSYALVTLANGCRGIIASDEEQTRLEIAACVGCGSCDDPDEFEGLAHLTEHITLATDPLGLQTFVDEERQGDTNAFTAERTTTFYTSFDVTKRVSRSRSAAAAEASIDAACKEDLLETSTRFAALFAAKPRPSSASSIPPVGIIKQEVGRVDAEMVDVRKRPSRGLVNLASYKARCSSQSKWRLLGRGDVNTLPAASEKEAKATSTALAGLRDGRYKPERLTFAAITPLPLNDAIPRVADAFAKIAPPIPKAAAAAVPPPPVEQSAAGTAAPAAAANTPFADESAIDLRPMAMVRPGARRAQLVLAWEVVFDDALKESRQKPLELVGRALISPHAHSLASVLRSRGLCPYAIELEPPITCKTLARVDNWCLWQIEISMAEGAESKWRQAAALTIAAVSRLAERGIPDHVAAEAQRMSNAAWRFSSRPPNAQELSADLQLENSPLEKELSIIGPRSFIGEPSTLATAATAAASQLSKRLPMMTVYSADLAPLGVAVDGPPAPQLPTPLDEAATMIPLRSGTSAASLPVTSPKEWVSLYASGIAPADLVPPPPNSWIPTSFFLVRQKGVVGESMVEVGYRFDVRGLQGKDPDVVAGSVGTLQLPGCVNRRTLAKIKGSRAALADATCLAQPSGQPALERPLATAVLQIDTPKPSSATVREAARAELWRLTLLEALSETTGQAAVAGLKCDLSFNNRGIRLVVSGYSQRLPKYTALLLRRLLRHLPPAANSPQLAAARRVAVTAAQNGRGPSPPGRLSELKQATPEQLQAELSKLFSSVRGASLLLAGALSREAAEALVAVVRGELAPLLPPNSYLPKLDLGSDAQPYFSMDDEYDEWSGLLYKPTFMSSWSLSACYDPAIARCLDQCGAL